MFGYDDIQRGGRRMVSGYVRSTVDRESLGLDWRWKSRSPGTTAAGEPPSLPHETLLLLGRVGHI